MDNTQSMQTVEAICAKYGIDTAHAQHAALNAARLFDELQPLHGLQPRSRDLLVAGAQLLEIGQTAGAQNAFNAGRDRVIAAPLMGFSPASALCWLVWLPFSARAPISGRSRYL